MEKTRQEIVDWIKSFPRNISEREKKIQAKAFLGIHVDNTHPLTVQKKLKQFILETKNVLQTFQKQIAREQGGSNPTSLLCNLH